MIGKELTEENGNKMPMGNQSANAGMAFNGSGAESGLSNQAANGETAINNNNLGSSMQKIPDKSMRDTANTLSTLDNWALLRKYQDGVTDGNINAQNHTDLSGIDRKWLQNQATGQKSILEIMDEARKQQNAPADFQRWKPYWAMCSEDRSVANFKDASGKISTKYFYDANGQPCRKFTDTTNGKSLLVSKSNPVAPNPTQPQNNGTIEQQAKTQEPKNAEKVNLDFDTDTWDRVTNQRVTGLHPKVQTATRGFINEVEKTLGRKRSFYTRHVDYPSGNH